MSPPLFSALGFLLGSFAPLLPLSLLFFYVSEWMACQESEAPFCSS